MLGESNAVPLSLILLTVVYYASLRYFSSSRFKSRGIHLPPGPKQKLITGNLHQLPTLHPWLTFTSWSKIYGPVVYLRVFNSETIILNSGKAASDLLESRSATYSDRPKQWMGGELARRKLSVFQTSVANPRFRALRRLLQTGLNARASKSYRPIQMQETLTLLQGFASSPEDFGSHIRRNAVALILKVAYGYQVASNDDPLVQHLEEAFRVANALVVPGKYWVEFFPILRFIPSWFPGAGFKRKAAKAGDELSQTERIPFEWARKEINTGDYIESFTSRHLLDEGKSLDETTLENIKWTAAALYVGGGDTTVSALKSFVLLMALHPEIQRQAQKDIDSIASDRLPTLDDYESLPFIQAIVKETLRWAPIAPLGLAHRVMEADIYENYFIPKGAKVVANIWAISRDEDMYPDPNVFDPNRHIGGNRQPDPFKFVFGFGKRVCPGAHLAEMSLFLNMASILAVFDISKHVDENGLEVEPDIAWTSTIVMHLQPFQCQIKPRSSDHLLLLS